MVEAQHHDRVEIVKQLQNTGQQAHVQTAENQDSVFDDFRLYVPEHGSSVKSAEGDGVEQTDSNSELEVRQTTSELFENLIGFALDNNARYTEPGTFDVYRSQGQDLYISTTVRLSNSAAVEYLKSHGVSDVDPLLLMLEQEDTTITIMSSQFSRQTYYKETRTQEFWDDNSVNVEIETPQTLLTYDCNVSRISQSNDLSRYTTETKAGCRVTRILRTGEVNVYTTRTEIDRSRVGDPSPNSPMSPTPEELMPNLLGADYEYQKLQQTNPKQYPDEFTLSDNYLPHDRHISLIESGAQTGLPEYFSLDVAAAAMQSALTAYELQFLTDN